MAPQRRAAALFDGGHHLELTDAQVAVLRLPPGRPVGAEDVRDLQGGAPHAEALRGGQALQRADHFAQQVGGHLGIEDRGLDLLVSEQHLDDPDVDLLFQQVGGEAMPKGVHRHPLVDPGRQRGGVHGAVELAGAQRLNRVEAGKQPAAVEHLALRPGHPPPGAQALEQQRRQHGVAILAPLALLDAQGHALTVDIADLQPDHLAGAQAGAVGHRQRRLVLQVAGRREQPGYLVPAQDHRQRVRAPAPAASWPSSHRRRA